MYGFNGYQYPMGMPQMDNRFNQLQQFQWQLQNLQQPQTQPQNNQLIGKIVDNIEMVKIADIPMDGNVYYFPKADGSEIYGKRWLPSGQTQTVTYKLFAPSEELVNNEEKVPTIETDGLLELFNSRFDELADKIEKLSKTTTPKAKKEASDE